MYAITTRVACEILDVSERTLTTYIKKGWLTADRNTRGNRLDYHQVMSLAENRKLHPEKYHKQRNPVTPIEIKDGGK